jgi:hypothetical protein
MSNASDYLWDFHFTLTGECSFHKIEGPPCIRLETREIRMEQKVFMPS